MLKLTKTIFLIALVFLLQFAKAQKKSWHLFKASAECTNLQFTSSPKTDKNYPWFLDENGNSFKSYLATNIASDENGKLLFTVISTLSGVYLYDINKKMVNGAPLTVNQGSKEIAIAPVNKGVKYHILAAGEIWEYDLVSNTAHSLTTLDKVVLKHGPQGSFADFIVAVRLNYVGNDPSKCISGYCCYYIRANPNGSSERKLCKKEFIVDSKNSRFANDQEYDITSINSFSTWFNTYVPEMDISPDGSKIAFADTRKIWVFNLKTGSASGKIGEITSLVNKLDYTQFGKEISIGGMEFTNDNSKLVYSVFQPDGQTGYEGVKLWDLSKTTSIDFASSSAFARSAIETGLDGQMYLAKADGLYSLDFSALKVSSRIVNLNLTKNTDLFKHYLGGTSDFGIYNLPDQLDGQKSEFLNLSQTVYTEFAGEISWDKAFVVPTNVSWNHKSHGLTSKGSDKVFVLGKLAFKTNSYTEKSMVLDGMEIQFYDDAECNIYQNLLFNIKGSRLIGMDCGLMWKGVDLRRNRASSVAKARIKAEVNSIKDECYISDAYNGIKTVGKWGVIEIKPYTVFARNERDISVSEIEVANLAITGAIMHGSIPLRDQTRGVGGIEYYDDFDDYLYRTITHILVNKSKVRIGELGDPAKTNWFHHAQHGVMAIASSVELLNADMTQTLQYGCWFNANKEKYKHSLTVQGSYFHSLMQGLRIEQEAKETKIYQNKFEKTWRYAIDYRQNHGGKLFIGNKFDASLKNVFKGCNWVAINCWDNAQYVDSQAHTNSSIEIYNNAIDDHEYAAGISVAEPSAGNRQYQVLQIVNNAIGQNKPIGQGIILKQIVGANGMLPLKNGVSGYKEEFTLLQNKINFTTILNPSYMGISAENSNQLNFEENTINSGTTADWRNTGIHCSEGFHNLVHKNVIQAGKGLVVSGNGIFSNYYCNTLNYCVNGIQLNHNLLREKATVGAGHNDNQIHAHLDKNIYGRHNDFNNRPSFGSDILVNNKAALFNQWDFTAGKVPDIVYTSFKGFSIRHNDTRLSICDKGIAPPQDPVELGRADGIDPVDISDPVLKWKYKYGANHLFLDGSGTKWFDEPSLTQLQKIEENILKTEYSLALDALIDFKTEGKFDEEFREIYSIWVNKRIQPDVIWLASDDRQLDTLWLDSVNYYLDSISLCVETYFLRDKTLSKNEVSLLSQIASQDALLVSPAAYPARAILWGETNSLFMDPESPFVPNVSGFVQSPCLNGGMAGLAVRVYDQNDVFTGIETTTNEGGGFIISGFLINQLDVQLKYRLKAQLDAGNAWMTELFTPYDLAMSGYHNLNCGGNLQKRNINIERYEFNLVPNPAISEIHLDNLPLEWHISISDIFGRKSIEQSGVGAVSLSLGKLPKGVYIATVIDLKTNEQQSKKFIVQ